MKCLRCGEELNPQTLICESCGWQNSPNYQNNYGQQAQQNIGYQNSYGQQTPGNTSYQNNYGQQAQQNMSYQNGYAQQMPGNANYQNNYGQQAPQNIGYQNSYGQQAPQNTSYQNSYGQQGMEGLGGIYGQSYEQHAETINGGRKYIPNIINIIMMVLAVIVVFVPYASLDGKTESIIKVFDVGALVLFVALIAFIADIVCVCIDNKGCFVAAFIISLISGGLLVFEFVLARIDYSKLPENASGQMLWGSWFGLLVGIILIISLPVWKIILNGLNKDKENI